MYTLNIERAKRLELPGRTCTVLVGNETLVSENMTFGVTEVPPVSKMNIHRHKQEEVIFILKGHGKVEVNGHVEEIKEGTVIYLPPDLEHYIENESDGIMRFTFVFHPTVTVGSYDNK